MKNTKRAKVAKKLALQKIENNIESICDDVITDEILVEAKRCFAIDDELYAKNSKQLSKTSNIHKMVNILFRRWAKQILKDDKLVKTVNGNLQTLSIAFEVLDKEGIRKINETLEGPKHQRYFIDVAVGYIKGDSRIYPTMNVNPRIWKGVVGAILFGVPKAEILRCKESILLNDYLPSINQSLQIQINELTTLGDIELIEDEIKKKQAECEKMNKYRNIKRKYGSRKNDKIIHDFYERGLSDTKIKDKLRGMDIIGYAYYELLKRRDEYKRQTRQIKGNMEI